MLYLLCTISIELSDTCMRCAFDFFTTSGLVWGWRALEVPLSIFLDVRCLAYSRGVQACLPCLFLSYACFCFAWLSQLLLGVLPLFGIFVLIHLFWQAISFLWVWCVHWCVTPGCVCMCMPRDDSSLYAHVSLITCVIPVWCAIPLLIPMCILYIMILIYACGISNEWLHVCKHPGCLSYKW